MSGPDEYAAALARLAALARFGMRPGLERIARVMAALGDPQARFPSLHIAGTNGKGSTAAIATRLLETGGARVGLYTSPHLARFTERIQVSGREIDRDRLAALLDRVLAADGGDALTFFEAATAIAFLHFADEAVDLAVIEVGLGGRFDATALCVPFASVITSIALDHTAELGPTHGLIAREKAGIARAGVPLLSGPLDEESERSVDEVARAAGAPRLIWSRDLFADRDGATLRYRGPGGALTAPLALEGEHQAGNAALALAATALAPHHRPPAERRAAALASVRWPARLEQVTPSLLLDAAHNAAGARALADAIAARGLQGVTLIVGVLADKDVPALLAPILPHAARAICVAPPSPRALPAASLGQQIHALAPSLPVEVADSPATALALAGDAPTVGCGSIYLVGLLRALALGEAVDPVATSDPAAREKL